MPPVAPKSKLNPSTPASGSLSPHTKWIVALLLLVCLAYANSLGAGLAFDNKHRIESDPRIRAVTATNLTLIFTTNYWWPKLSVDYRPFTLLTYMFNYAVLGGGADPLGYHIINLLLHWFNAVLVYFLFLLIWSEPVMAFVAAGLFAVHPVGTEAVTNIVGRADLLALACIIGGLLIYIRAARAPAGQRGRWLAALAAVGTVGAFSKESAMALPGVILLYDFTWRLEPLHPSIFVNLWRNLWLRLRSGCWVAVAPVAAFWVVRTAVFSGLPKATIPFLDNPLVGADFWTARATAIKVFGKYLRVLAWPATLSSDYSYNQIPLVDWGMRRWQDWLAVVSTAVIALLIAVAVRSYCRRKDVFFFIGFFFLTLAPLANFVFPIGTIMAERLLYLPLMGFAGFVVIAVREVAGRLAGKRGQVVAYACCGLLIAVTCLRTVNRNRDWASDETLSFKSVETSPNSFKTHAGLAAVLMNSSVANIDRALAEAETARRIMEGAPKDELDVDTLVNLGGFYRKKGDSVAEREGGPSAAAWYTKSEDVLMEAADTLRRIREKRLAFGRAADRMYPLIKPEIYTNLGEIRLRQRRFDEARRALETAVAMAPGQANLYLVFARFDFATAQPEHGLAALHAAVSLDRTNQEALSELRSVYRKVDPQGCGVTADLLSLHRSSCQPVQQYRCAGYRMVVQYADAVPNASYLASQARKASVVSGCPAGSPAGAR